MKLMVSTYLQGRGPGENETMKSAKWVNGEERVFQLCGLSKYFIYYGWGAEEVVSRGSLLMLST